jgi:hypothetical protein
VTAVRWPWTHPDTRQLLDAVAADLNRAVMELEAEVNINQAALHNRKEDTNDHRR